ncbi:Conserved_hypothetical protein [Hexamita inflata]|uniref:Uncharacterized protein n=1 Tax=Hexamita inflata TaxID=28002 RepID=A0AA86ULU5_9EUKA|nr:Conserved hypothetical protein [Hexamita inflata]CAI9956406.1 Conserved hypothetical protein [Hexamita inflata]
MITQLCALSEMVWQNEQQAGELKKYNVKLQIKTVLMTDTSITQQIAETLLDDMIDKTIQNNTKSQLIQLAQNILKISVKASGCLSTWSSLMTNHLVSNDTMSKDIYVLMTTQTQYLSAKAPGLKALCLDD